MDLKLKDKDILIEGMALPMPLQISLDKRGKTVVNHRYIEDEKKLQIYCSSCNIWHPVFKLDNGTWVDINQTYKLCNVGKEREYFDTYCLQCYENKKNKDDTKTIKLGGVAKALTVNKEKVTKSGEGGEYLPWSEKNGGIQQTISLAPELDMYLKLYGVFQNKKKNQLINEIIAEFKSKNPINL
ncbi:hypothetical protein [Cytobacillus praedii]|uniref:hypothetical protein n=1 Tax=Cytobacillus praedii TaxID=1742358 RepID=UPI002E1B80E3|nr:hypothetical protein [Cytobacillus praedii]